ncbi:lipoprotein [Streptococcus gallolyticus]|uniref:Lipoprotein n=1 Tax=Streptococcus gallolyticus TaxID=315405 RepID=A0AA94S9V7_9STRE|nr:hypothetical protein [Streptococcus gallolyticus]AQP41413.1 hypothetical protein BTR42_02070 [Streptococcus gallolyticus subsp. gallolyticus DSM 16831]MCQ9217051.1 hypothetical protein [Streptococcus gallolyticus]SQG78693.1 lipoprotein [Streptococcus gallolyticus]
MKLRHLIALGVAGCAGYAAYHVYKNRDQFKAEIVEADDISERISTDIAKIRRSIDDINNQLPILQTISQDLDYKRRLFEQETNSRLEQIKATLAKYQKEN